MGIASGVPTTFLSVGPEMFTHPDDFVTALLNEANYLLSLENPPNVLTSSYGINEANVTQSMANSICNAYMQLGARGTSVLFSSGDGGVGGNHPTSCDDEPFLPPFPGSCPYVTTVGGTQLNLDKTESGADFSSGGFSNYFAAPSYQTSSVSSYIQNLGSEYQGLYNATGRGLPDVATIGVNFTVAGSFGNIRLSGTSASTPVFAGIIALLNDELIAAGKSPLGFLNPFLYSEEGIAALNDITTGNNPGCGTDGFAAENGWDPVTGLGTPDYSKLRSAIGL